MQGQMILGAGVWWVVLYDVTYSDITAGRGVIYLATALLFGWIRDILSLVKAIAMGDKSSFYIPPH